MPASSAGGRHPHGLVEPSMGKHSEEVMKNKFVEQDDEALVGNKEAHEIAGRCISEMFQSIQMSPSLWAIDSLSASNPVIASSSLIRDV